MIRQKQNEKKIMQSVSWICKPLLKKRDSSIINQKILYDNVYRFSITDMGYRVKLI